MIEEDIDSAEAVSNDAARTAAPLEAHHHGEVRQ